MRVCSGLRVFWSSSREGVRGTLRVLGKLRVFGSSLQEGVWSMLRFCSDLRVSWSSSREGVRGMLCVCSDLRVLWSSPQAFLAKIFGFEKKMTPNWEFVRSRDYKTPGQPFSHLAENSQNRKFLPDFRKQNFLSPHDGSSKGMRGEAIAC